MVLLVLASACKDASSHSPTVNYADSVLGRAHMMQDYSPRIVKVVDVSDRYPDPANVVQGAVVLVDIKLGRGFTTLDYVNRPVLVRYETRRAALGAVRHLPADSFGIRWTDVVVLPADFPAHASRRYRRAVTVAVQ